jgi:hypothetical protein
LENAPFFSNKITYFLFIFSGLQFPGWKLAKWVSRMPITEGDLKPEVIDWLIANFDTELQYERWSSVVKIVGQVLDESAVHEKLIPLLSSSNSTVRANAYLAVKTAERTLGKRLLKLSVDQEQRSEE